VSSGSACLVGSVQPSHVLAAMGVPAEWASATVRFSMGAHIRDEDLTEIVRRVRQVVTNQRTLRGWKKVPVLQEVVQHEVFV
jgi:cysteine desulfurase